VKNGLTKIALAAWEAIVIKKICFVLQKWSDKKLMKKY
jgi:hypothetical protein